MAAIATALALFSFCLFATLAARDVIFGDGPELTAAAILDGVAHPPGYPLWILLGHVASLLPVGSLPFRVNLTASLYHAIVVGLVFASGYVLTKRVVPAVLAALLLAVCSPLFVTWSLAAEVFSLNDVFAAGIVLACLGIIDAPKSWRRLLVPLAALFGLGLSNQQTLLLLGPLAVWALWCARAEISLDGRTIRIAAIALLVLVAGFALPYVHTILASQRYTTWVVGIARTPQELIDVIDRRMFGGTNLVPHAVDRGGSVWERLAAVVGAGGWPWLFIAAGIGAAALRKQFAQVVAAVLLLLFPLVTFCAVAGIDAGDAMLRSVFLRFGLLPLVVLAPFSAICFAAIGERLSSRAIRAGAAAVSFAAVFAYALFTLPALSLADFHGPRTLNRDIFAALPPRAILLTAGDPVDGTVPYFQQIEHWRPDVTHVAYGLLNLEPYVRSLQATIAVPNDVLLPYADQLRRDVLVGANTDRPFYVTGERGIHAPGPKYHPASLGVVSRMISNATSIGIKQRYAEEVALENAPGYGDVQPIAGPVNGFVVEARQYYAGGFFSTGYDAEQLGDIAAAYRWYRLAQIYFPDPLIARQLDELNQKARLSTP